MTHNIFVKCDICDSVLDLKWQVGYLPKSKIIVSCGKCKSTIKGTLYTDNENIKIKYDIENAKEIPPTEDFKCDFIVPISGELITEKMKLGYRQYEATPFMHLVTLVGIENFSLYQKRFLDGIDIIENQKNTCDRINELYFNKQFAFLKKYLKDNLNVKVKHGNFNEILTEKYKREISFFSSFLNFERYNKKREMISKYLKKIQGANKIQYQKLIEYFSNDIDKFEKRLFDVINIFINTYESFIPVILLEYVNKNLIEEISSKYAITTVYFEDIRSMYLRIYENIMEVSSLLIGLDNIMYRNNYQKIDASIISGKTNIEQYIKMSKGNKVKYTVTDEIFNSIIPVFDKDIRNAIGHEDIEYDIFNQKLKYNDGECYLIEYVYNIWKCYESCLLIYEIILDAKYNMLKLQNKLSERI